MADAAGEAQRFDIRYAKRRMKLHSQCPTIDISTKWIALLSGT
jgi:hypothetical protein